MWDKIPGFILRKRLPILITVVLLTAFMGYRGSFNEITYEFTKLLPESDSTLIDYERFKKTFGQDGNVMVIGIKKKDIFELENFKTWYELGNFIKQDDMVKEVVSVAHINKLTKIDSLKKFRLYPLISKTPTTQAEVDSLKEIILSQPFYHKIFFNDTSYATLMAVGLDRNIINTKQRNPRVQALEKNIEKFLEGKDFELHYSGLPYVRTGVSTKIQNEIVIFVALTALLTAIVLFLFFRSIYVVFSCLSIVIICVLISTGTVNLFGYKLTSLLALIPPLIIVIGIPNCVYLINRYHQEYHKHQNKALALVRMVRKIGGATFLTNLTTAIGFGTFVFTSNRMLIEFGIIASLNVMVVFILSLLIIPIILSYLPPPDQKNIQHLENRPINAFIQQIIEWIQFKRSKIYWVSLAISAIAIYGMLKIETSGKIVDDIPTDDKIYTDLMFFEDNFGGVMPFEVEIDTKKDGKAIVLKTLQKIEQLQNMLGEYTEFSPSISIADAVKYSKQTFYGGAESKYSLPNNMEVSFLAPYLKTEKGADTILRAFVNPEKSITRVSVQMADIGTIKMENLKKEVEARADSIFDKEEYNVTFTGSSIVFMKGTGYLINNLTGSLILAIILISGIMAVLFRSFSMVIVSILPNLIPLLVTAAIMGYFGINLKPSTILVFSIAFGISVDDTIHFLAKYRQDLLTGKFTMKEAIIHSLRESGVSMTYTSIILFFGFSVFMFSSFGGNVALGLLVSITLVVAMLSNLILLPSLLMTMESRIVSKALSQPSSKILEESQSDSPDDDVIDEDNVKDLKL